MRVTRSIAIVLAAALVTAAGAGATPSKAPGIQYSFLGQLTAAPANGQLAVTVQQGNPAALRVMLGQSVDQSFSYGNNTEFLKWSKGVPHVVQASDLAVGDFVWIHIRDNRGASLAAIEAKNAGRVDDHGSQINPPSKPLYLFRGTLTGTGSDSVTLTVNGGNGRATHLLIGQPKSQTFSVDASTIFLLWQGKVPTVISLAQLKIGDPVAVRIRAGAHAPLAKVESTPAVHVGELEPAPPPMIQYLFVAQLNSAPANGQLAVTVQRGNRAALKAMLGQSVDQTFAYGNNTEFLKWSHGVPTVVQASDLAAGDFVWIHVRDTAGASLADIESKAAGLVGDRSQLNPPSKPLYLFRGTLTGATSDSVTLTVHGGNRAATRLLIGQPKSQTFTVGASTIFLLWQGKVPTVISLGQLTIGDKVVVRIRAPKHATLANVESTVAGHVGDREPANQ
ncbi:MAG TPA: hypothetical protein VKB43_03580 [Gaiellaceae bacterium]|nr:hypothetical protein [Gaiellaceae bacterium]